MTSLSLLVTSSVTLDPVFSVLFLFTVSIELNSPKQPALSDFHNDPLQHRTNKTSNIKEDHHTTINTSTPTKNKNKSKKNNKTKTYYFMSFFFLSFPFPLWIVFTFLLCVSFCVVFFFLFSSKVSFFFFPLSFFLL